MSGMVHQYRDRFGHDYWILAMVSTPEDIQAMITRLESIEGVVINETTSPKRRVHGFEQYLEAITYDPDKAVLMKLML